jgi:hypothetical protein
MGEWLTNFQSADNSKVNSPTVIAAIITVILAALAIPVTILGMFAVHHHIWVLKKGLDSSVTTLLLGLAGGGGIGMGAGYAAARFGRPPPAKPAPLQGE